MWLAETAVDLESLDLLAEAGIRFTLLAPRQAAAVRRIGKGRWRQVSGGRIDPRHPYLCRLPSGRAIHLFFYDGPISQQLAFEGLLDSGEAFAGRLMGAFTEDPVPQLVHVATDGETYGHHHRHGEMALSYCLHRIEADAQAKVTVYGEFLDLFPPENEVRIHEDSSWSCVHGVERWRDDCGCHSGMHGQWHQAWRRPLREALDALRDELLPLCEARGRHLLPDLWKARDAYIDVVLDRSPGNVEAFLQTHAGRTLAEEETSRALCLLETLRHALLMYTSCGWFFDEISGIETTQVLQYASRAIQLGAAATGEDLEEAFLRRLRDAPSNLPEHGNGEAVYRKFVQPARIDLMRVGAHHAIASLFEEDSSRDRIFCYRLAPGAQERLDAGPHRLVVGHMQIRSDLTWERKSVVYAALHLGGMNVSAGVGAYANESAFVETRNALTEVFRQGDLPETIRRLDSHFEDRNYTLWHLFRDEQRAVTRYVFEGTETGIEGIYREICRSNYSLMQSMAALGLPLPSILHATARFVLNLDLRECLAEEPLDASRFERLEEDIRRWWVSLDRESLGLQGSQQIEELVRRLEAQPLEEQTLERIEDLLKRYLLLDVPLNLWHAQNTVHEIGLQQFFLRNRLVERGDDSSAEWVRRFREVSDLLGVRFEE